MGKPKRANEILEQYSNFNFLFFVLVYTLKRDIVFTNFFCERRETFLIDVKLIKSSLSVLSVLLAKEKITKFMN